MLKSVKLKDSDFEISDVKRQWRQKTVILKSVMVKSGDVKFSDVEISDVKSQWFWNQWR